MKSEINFPVVLRRVAFSLMGAVVLLLVVAGFVEKLCGTEVAVRYVYAAPWTIVLWALAALSALLCLCFCGMHRTQVVTFLLHVSFVVVLAGALLTHLTGRNGTLHLRVGESADMCMASDGTGFPMPFALCLDTFFVEWYPGTHAPMDYVSRVSVQGTDVGGVISMNRIFSYRWYRFYQMRYDADVQGAAYRVVFDPWGISVTYAGYVMLLLSLLCFFGQRRTHFRFLLSELRGKSCCCLLCCLLCCGGALCAEQNVRPKTLQRGLAEAFGNLYIAYGERVCSVHTLAVDFCTELCGRSSWQGFTAEQVLTGWLFYYDDWKKVPLVKIKGTAVRRALGVEQGYAALDDFYDVGGYRLQALLEEGDSNARMAGRKVQLLTMVATGAVFKIFPHTDAVSGKMSWYAWTDILPASLSYEEWRFERGVMDYVAMKVGEGRNAEAEEVLLKLRKYQVKQAAGNLPAYRRIGAERFYLRLQEVVRPLAMACMILGAFFFLLACLYLAKERAFPLAYRYISGLWLCVLFCWLTFLLGLRWYVAGHVPLSNGFETMQFLAWVTLMLSLVLSRWFVVLLPFGSLVCGMSLLVSSMGFSNPRITLLAPVLQSPLLGGHVMLVMLAYALLAFLMLNGVVALVLAAAKRSCTVPVKRLQTISGLLLYPAVFCLIGGIFIGAVWANVSWGRYWGWDPKETWALVTMIVYGRALHTAASPWLQKPVVFHLYMVLAFFCVLFTYFGVNFLLGGMHGYA